MPPGTVKYVQSVRGVVLAARSEKFATSGSDLVVKKRFEKRASRSATGGKIFDESAAEEGGEVALGLLWCGGWWVEVGVCVTSRVE